MAVLSGQSVRPILGGIDNPNLTTDHWAFAWVNQFAPSPYVSDTQRAGQAPLTTHWPVAANGRSLSGQRRRAHVDDWYHRIHISPQQLDLGNVVSAQTTPIYLWNAFLEPRTLTTIQGLEEGIEVGGQPSPPMLFPALAEKVWQVSVTPDGQPVLDTTLGWAFDNGALASLRITANRIVAWSFAPDWGSSIRELLEWLTDILTSESLVEQRRALRLSPRRQFEAALYVEGRERQLLDLALFGWGTRVWALPIWPDIQLLAAPVPAGSQRIDCDTQHLDFAAGGIAMLRGEDAFTFEVVEIESVDASGLDLNREIQQSWPVGSRLYPARPAQLAEQPTLRRLTDTVQSAEVRFLVLEPSVWPDVMPAGLYRGRPVFDTRPDESEDLTGSYARLLASLDSGLSLPLVTDVAGRAMPVQEHRWLDMGRATRAAYRSLLYALRGRQRAIWLPTHADDMTAVATITSVATTIDIEAIGYTRFGQARPGRWDIRIELWDDTVFHRRITGATELSADIERLALDSALGQQVEPSDIRRISWLVLCRLDVDQVEIEHITDSEGVAASSLIFRGVRDDEFS
ncbi:hypothetical protein [Ectopseudomonas oleovorans]|uniref:Uncharacterized protein n=1 Tax=Ectopseudomonas oleovorans (strain CECT 5344) TaxID=1182590 RepID=W6R7M3_ECTO5|nr:hypothetical protein [Pseudomonas oleovorans]CDM42381.1 hypothetical protein BN5_3839 [Pseudomonas oleovorans CECT 5344]CDR93004.1 hypothetical protein PPSAL_3780 [Pseudomonas oleovorans]